MSRQHPANRLDQAIEERVKDLRRGGLTVRQIRAQLLAEGERVATSTVGEICKGLAAGEPGPQEPETTPSELANGLEAAALESEEGVSLTKERLLDAIDAGNVELAVGLSKALAVLNRTRSDEIKNAQLLRGKPTSRGASVKEAGPGMTDDERALLDAAQANGAAQ